MRCFRFILIWLLISTDVLGQVNSKNGNYYVSYGDLAFRGDLWSIERVYNSITAEESIFGWGWGSNIATRMWPLPDGQLMVIYYGSGGQDLYLPDKLDPAGVNQMIDSIIADEVRRNKLQYSPVNVVRRRAELIADPSGRANTYVNIQKRLGPRFSEGKEPIHDKWINEYRESETVRWGNNLYYLKRYDDEFYFDRSGRMMRWRKSDTDIHFNYDTKGQLISVCHGKDTAHVTMNDQGYVRSIRMKDSAGVFKQAHYEYDAKGLLIRSIDADSNIYRHEYDRNYNMTFIRYSNGTYRHMEYDPATNRIIGFRERTGDSSGFGYGYLYHPDGRLNLDHYYTRKANYDTSGKPIFLSYSEWENRYNEAGDRYLYRVFEKTDTSDLLYLYPSTVGNIVYGKKNDREAWQDFDAKTRPIYLRFGDSVYTTRYHVNGLPERFQAIDSVRRDTTTFIYSYDAQGHLSKVVRNKVAYVLRGRPESGRVDIVQGGQTWSIIYIKGQSSFFTGPGFGKLSMDDLNKPAHLLVKQQYLDIVQLLQPQKIEHEWIWDRL